MWKRSQVKERGKISFKRNYWKCVLISLLLILIIGGGSSASSGAGDTSHTVSGKVQNNITDETDILDGEDGDSLENDITTMIDEGGIAALAVFVSVFLIVFIICMAIALVLNAFIVNPLAVGCRRFFVRKLN